MNKEYYLKYANNNFKDEALNIVIRQIEKYYESAKEYKLPNHNYNIGDDVYLKKGTLLHGSSRNINGLESISKDGLIASWFIDGRISKYPSSVGVWNLKQDYYLKDYINFYSGGTIRFNHMNNNKETKTKVIPYDEIKDLMDNVSKSGFIRWYLEQTKEARFMPSLTQEEVQIGFIFNSDNKYIDNLKKGDILSNTISDEIVKQFVNERYANDFINERKEKDDFFTNRESAILFGIPSCFIEGILVGRKYEKDSNMLDRIKEYLPNVYICNLDGKVIRK